MVKGVGVRAIFVSVLLLLATSCSPADRSGVGLDEATGHPKLFLANCDDELVTSVDLWTTRWERIADDIPDLHRVPDQLLWRIEATDPIDTSEVLIGRPNEGFTTTASSTDQPFPNDLIVETEINGSWRWTQTFALDELRADTIQHYGPVTVGQFERERRAECDRGLLQTLGLIYDDPPWLLPVLAVLTLGVAGGTFALWQRRRGRDPSRDVRAPSRGE
jgi:hypothetical protein